MRNDASIGGWGVSTRALNSAHLFLDLLCLSLGRVESLLAFLFHLFDDVGALVLCLFEAVSSLVLGSGESLACLLLELLEAGLGCRAGWRNLGRGGRGDDANTWHGDRVERALAVGVCRSETETGSEPDGESSSC